MHLSDTPILFTKISPHSLGVSIAAGLHLIPSRTQKLSPSTANLVPRKLGANLARCPLFFHKSPAEVILEQGFFIFGAYVC